MVEGFGVDVEGHFGARLIEGGCGGGKPELGLVRACAAALQEGDPFVGCGREGSWSEVGDWCEVWLI